MHESSFDDSLVFQNEAASSMGLIIFPEALIKALKRRDHARSKAVPLVFQAPLARIVVTCFRNARWKHFDFYSIVSRSRML